VRQAVEAGEYASTGEVIRDAPRAIGKSSVWCSNNNTMHGLPVGNYLVFIFR